MDEIVKTADDCNDKELAKREHQLTRFVVCNAPMMPRETLIKYYVKIRDIYKRLVNTKKVFDFQKLINEAKDPRKYLDMIEPEYEARCEHFSGDDRTINVIHENLITVCEELGLFDKASYYRSRLTEWLETKQKQRMCVMKEQSISFQKTFDSFIVSRSNVEAYSACVDLVNDPKGKLVAIFGANSYGKSHLLYAIKNALVEGNSDLSIRFTNYDDVISQYITSLHNREHKVFVEEPLETDVLIMDNMQFIGGKEAIQDEVADWINKLVEAGKSVVIAFDRPIKYFSPLLKEVEERHPDSCTVAEVRMPDRFLRKKYIEFLLTVYPVILPRFLKGYIIISRRIPFSALTGFIHKCSLLEKQKGQAHSIREIRGCLSGYMHKEV